MGDKMRNTYRKATMRNFSKYTIERYIMIDDDTMTKGEQDEFVKEINEKLWYAIQETNAVAEEVLLPFVIVRRVIRDDTKLRIIINDINSSKRMSDYEETQEVDINKITHLINFKMESPQRRVLVCDDLIPGNACMIIDKRDQIAAAVDIYLDIAMFNAISFLNSMELSAKKEFNLQKLAFYREQGLESYYEIDEDVAPAYFSFAFAARVNTENLDVYKYMRIWKKFIDSKFSGNKVVNIKPVEQLSFHRDKDNFEDRYFEDCTWDGLQAGAYLLLRINSMPESNERKEMIKDYFGAEQFHVGITKVMPISEYFKPFLRQQIDELYVSAFKIIV